MIGKFISVFFQILFIVQIIISSSYANAQLSETSDSMSMIEDIDLLPILQKINSLSKKNEQLKSRINNEIRKQDVIISKISKLTNTVSYKVENGALAGADEALSVSDFKYIDDSLLRKCNDITLDYFDKKNTQQSEFIKNLYDTEPIDSEWTSEVSSGINDHIASQFPDTEVISVNCTSSVCEINLKHGNKNARADFNLNFNPDNQWNIIDTQSKNDVLSKGSFVSIQIGRDGESVSQ